MAKMESPPRYAKFESKADRDMDWRASSLKTLGSNQPWARVGSLSPDHGFRRRNQKSKGLKCHEIFQVPQTKLRKNAGQLLNSSTWKKISSNALLPLHSQYGSTKPEEGWVVLRGSGKPVRGQVSSPKSTADFIGIETLPQELLEIIFYYLDTWSKGSAAQVCKHWNRIFKFNKLVWANATITVRNPVFKPLLGGFVHSDAERTFGAVVLQSKLKDLVQHCGIRSAKMVGANIHREPCHVKQLGIELPNLIQLELHRCVLSQPSLKAAYNAFPELRVVVITHGWTSDNCEHLRNLKNLRSLVLQNCGILDHVLIKIARSIPTLSLLQLRGCQRLTKDGIQWCRDRFPKLQVEVSPKFEATTRRKFPKSRIHRNDRTAKCDSWQRTTSNTIEISSHDVDDNDRWDSPRFWGPICPLPCC